MGKMSLLLVGASALVWAHGASAIAEETSAFDGTWAVSFYCPTYDKEGDHAKGYRQQFSAQVKGGQLSGGHGAEGEPGSYVLAGPIAPDGSAMLRLRGVVGSESHAINEAPRGKPYTYRVKAQFEAGSGKGERLGQRRCDFEFKRQS